MKKIFLLLGMICFTISVNAMKLYSSIIIDKDTIRFFYCPLPSGDTVVYVITSDSTVSAGSDYVATTALVAPVRNNYFLNKNIREKNVIIPEKVEYEGREYTVTRIAKNAFYKDSNIISLNVPKSVETIGFCAFTDSGIEEISPLHVKNVEHEAFRNVKMKNIDFSRCPADTLNFQGMSGAFQWIKFPVSVKILQGIFVGGINLKILIIPPGSKSFFQLRAVENQIQPTILLSKTPLPYGPTMPIKAVILYPCGADSAYRISSWATWYDSIRPCHFLNLDSGYIDLDSVCPWEVERKYGFHPDTVGLYIVEKHNPYDCDSFNVYFVKSFLDPGELYDTTIQIEPDRQDTSVLWTWEGTGYAYNVYRGGDYITTVEHPYYLDTNIEMDVQYCYNFAPVNEKYCEGKWSTTNCYTMLSDTTGIAEHDAGHSLVIYPNPAKNVLFISANEPSNVNGRINGTAYEVTDVIGRIVLQGRYNASEGIRVSGLAKGIYLLRMEGKVGKFVKE